MTVASAVTTDDDTDDEALCSTFAIIKYEDECQELSKSNEAQC